MYPDVIEVTKERKFEGRDQYIVVWAWGIWPLQIQGKTWHLLRCTGSIFRFLYFRDALGSLQALQIFRFESSDLRWYEILQVGFSKHDNLVIAFQDANGAACVFFTARDRVIIATWSTLRNWSCCSMRFYKHDLNSVWGSLNYAPLKWTVCVIGGHDNCNTATPWAQIFSQKRMTGSHLLKVQLFLWDISLWDAFLTLFSASGQTHFVFIKRRLMIAEQYLITFLCVYFFLHSLLPAKNEKKTETLQAFVRRSWFFPGCSFRPSAWRLRCVRISCD